MEQVNYAKTEELHLISDELYQRLDRLGLIPNEVRNNNVGKSDYSKHTIQPWSIWIDYELNPWDADIVKRTLRTKEEPGMSAIEARIMDYDKIEHICRERKRQLRASKENSEIQDSYTFIKENYLVPPADTSASTLDVASYDSSIIAEEVEKFSLANYKPERTINYSLNEEQVQKYSKFVDKHSKCRGHINTIFSPASGIGMTVKVKCSRCGETLDITDVSNW